MDAPQRPLRVAVLGAGNGGFAAAADLALRGHEVRLFQLPEFADSLEPVRAAGGIRMEVLPSFPRPGGFARLAAATTDPAEALTGADVALLTVPAFAHDRYAEVVAPHLRPGQALLLFPGYLGTPVFARALQARGLPLEGGPGAAPGEGVLLGEAESLIYAARKTAPDAVWVRGYKRGLRLAAFPARATPRLVRLVRTLYPDVEPAASVLETGLSNANALIHPPLMLLNAAHIERTGGDFLFYHEGMTPAVGRLIELLDEERLAVGRAWGVPLRPLVEQDLGWYAHQGARGPTIYHTHVTNPIYAWSKAPPGLEHRYVAEDIPYGLVTLESLARHAGVPVPRTGALVELFSGLLGRDFRAEGRTLARLGLDGWPVGAIRDLFERGGPLPPLPGEGLPGAAGGAGRAPVAAVRAGQAAGGPADCGE